jgi:hypothetical protein
MITLIYDHKDHTIRTSTSGIRSLVHFDKLTSTFSTFFCEASDLNAIDIQIPGKFTVKVEANGHTKVFSYAGEKRDDEGELQYYIFKSSDQYKFIIFND